MITLYSGFVNHFFTVFQLFFIFNLIYKSLRRTHADESLLSDECGHRRTTGMSTSPRSGRKVRIRVTVQQSRGHADQANNPRGRRLTTAADIMPIMTPATVPDNNKNGK